MRGRRGERIEERERGEGRPRGRKEERRKRIHEMHSSVPFGM